MDNYKEIVTKAVVGKSKKSSTDTYEITTENIADRVLGCWIINHRFNGTSNNDNIKVNGTFDVWSALNKGTIVTITVPEEKS